MNNRIVAILLCSAIGVLSSAFAAEINDDQNCKLALGREHTQNSHLKRFTSNVIEAIDKTVDANLFHQHTEVKRPLNYTAIKTCDGKRFSESEMFLEKSDLIIGIDVTGNTKGHMYFIINDESSGTRVDGRMFWAGYTTSTEWTISPGLIIRYTGLSPEDKLALIDLLKRDLPLKSATCVGLTCKYLLAEGPLAVDGKIHIFPSIQLQALAEHGLKGSDGQLLEPEIFTVNSEIDLFWNNLPSWQTVPKFIFKVFFDPYTWQGFFK